MKGRPSGAYSAAMSDYRKRIYAKYVSSHIETLSPSSIEGFKPRSAYLKKLIRDFFPGDKTSPIMDLGCGHGAIIYFARLAGYSSISGIDRSPQQVAEAKRLGIEGVTEGDLIESLKRTTDNSLEMVITFDVIEHFTREELFPFADEVFRVLKSGGTWLVHTVNAESPFAGKVLYSDLTHEQAFTRVSLTQLFKTVGFREVGFFEDVPAVHGLKSFARFVSWKFIRSFLRFYIAVETGSTDSSSIFSQNLIATTKK